MGNRGTPETTEIGLDRARNEFHRIIKTATSSKTRFVIWRGPQREYVAALLAYEDFQQLTAVKEAATSPPSATGTAAVTPPPTRLFAEYLHTVGNEDRIAAEHIQGMWPLVVVADGVGGTPGGAAAADAALAAARAYLHAHVPKLSSCEQVLHVLRKTFFHAAAGLREQGCVGATTLLIGLLWSSPAGSVWCYGYVGDGFLMLLSPSRKVDGLTVPERLLTPQKVNATACVRRTGPTGTPVVGLRLREPGDLLYLGTDGIIPLYRWVRGEYGESLNYFLETRVGPRREWVELLRACPRYVDDAVMGIITTETHDR